MRGSRKRVGRQPEDVGKLLSLLDTPYMSGRGDSKLMTVVKGAVIGASVGLSVGVVLTVWGLRKFGALL